jgi:dihydropteroate synthase
MPVWRCAETTLEPDPTRPLAAGIVNVTPDSMYEGARSGTPERAIADGVRLAAAGFDLLDVGAVPARSGPTIDPRSEAARLLPTIAGLAERVGVPLSADTSDPGLARRAVTAGAAAINDIGGGTDAMLEAIAEAGCGYVLMHIEGPPRHDRAVPDYPDVVARLREFFGERIERALELGVKRETIAIDPGLDFDLDTDDAIEILGRLGELRALGRPIFISLSRKDFIGAILAGSWERRRAAADRGAGTLAAATIAAATGAEIHRLHDPEALDAIRVAAAIGGTGRSAGPREAADGARA